MSYFDILPIEMLHLIGYNLEIVDLKNLNIVRCIQNFKLFVSFYIKHNRDRLSLIDKLDLVLLLVSDPDFRA